MTGDDRWYEAAFVVGITNALNVVADGLGGAVMRQVEPATAPGEGRAIFPDIPTLYGTRGGGGAPGGGDGGGGAGVGAWAGGVPPARGGRSRRRNRALPPLHRHLSDRRGAHVSRLDLFLPGSAR